MLARFIVSKQNSVNVLKHIRMTPYFNVKRKSVATQIMWNSNPSTSVPPDLKEKFEAVAPELVKTITEIEYFKEISQVKEMFEKLLAYNLFDGKKNRGLQTVVAYRIISSQPGEEELKLACLLGWCVELLQAFYLVHDDIIDGSELRRSRPCWYRLRENGLNAINDGVLLENCIYVILQKYLRNKSYYMNIIESFHEVIMKTSIGQVLDMKISQSFQLEKSFDPFTLEHYLMIVKYKTAYYSFQLPVTIALYMAGITDKSKHERATSILLDIGQYFQIQDDFLDCYGDTQMVGKSGNDIAEGKCTWLVVNALRLADAEQKKKLQENYGKPDLEKVESVVRIYNSLGLRNEFEKYEKQIYEKLTLEIDKLPQDLPREIFIETLNKIHKRMH